MRNVVHQFSIALLALLVIVTGCKKDDVIQKPGGGGHPGNGQTTNAFKIVVDSLPGEIMPIYGLHAMFSIVNDQNQEVLVDRKMALNYAGKYATDTLKLDPKTYRITKLWIRDDNNKTLFAAPLVNSAKAAEVENPLPFSFLLPKPTVSNISVQVAKVNASDKPEHFGYTEGSFNNDGQGGETPVSFVKIKIQPKIRIGEVVYDSIPVAIHIRTTDRKGETTLKVVNLKAGINEISLDRTAQSYRIILSKWGTMDELVLNPADVQEGTVYILGGHREAKLLQSELIFKLENGQYKPFRKQSYFYNAGKLSEIKYFGKKADNTSFLEMNDKFQYNGIQKVSSIKRFNEFNNLSATYEFTYDQGGRISGTKEINNDQTITGVVNYAAGSGIDGVDGDYNIHVRYTLSLSGHTIDYNQVFKGGNRIWDNSVTSNQTRETGSYQYDVSINPYIHMNWPDVFLSRSSKHNMVLSGKEFYGSYSTAVPAKFEYSYDTDGYPTQVITTYVNAFGIFLYKTKTVYNY